MSTNIYLVRHGQSIGNLKDTFLGHTDWDLTDLGKKQAELVPDFFENLAVDGIYSSDLMRAKNTVAPLARKKGLDIILDKNLREIYAGKWEAVKFEDIPKSYPEMWKIWQNAEFDKVCAPEGESGQELLDRVYSALEKIALENEGKNIVIGIHATPIRVFMNKIAGLSLKDLCKTPWVANASVSHFKYENGEFSAVNLSQTAHLGSLITALPKGV